MFFVQETSLWQLRAFGRAEQLRWVEKNFEEMKKADQCSDEMKTVEKNLSRWHVRREGMRWGEVRWGEKSSHDLRWDEVWSVKCGVWRAQCEVWGKCLLGVALRRGRAQVMFLDNNTATASHKARTHGPSWRTAHASSIDEKGLIVYP